jgi:prophage tail gpP-like protein
MSVSKTVPDSGAVVTLGIPATGLLIDTWKSYHFNDHFLTPTDGWSMTLGDEIISDQLLTQLIPGAIVQFTINGHIQSTGYIDSVTVDSSRAGGLDVVVEGRDVISRAYDVNIDPRLQFKANYTLVELLVSALGPFSPPGVSWANEGAYLIDNTDNKNIISGAVRGPITRPKVVQSFGDRSLIPTNPTGGPNTALKGRRLQDVRLHQTKPWPNEGALAFSARVCQRQGLWIWATSDGTKLVVGQPNFDEEPRFTLTHRLGANSKGNNILHSSVKRDSSEQPSVIVATGFGSGGEYDRAKLKAMMINPIAAYDKNGNLQPDVQAFVNNHTDAKLIASQVTPPSTARFTSLNARPMFLHDDESKTAAELENFIRREMALKMHKAFWAKYTVEGHTNGGNPWCVDAGVSVDDDVSNVHGNLWILSRSFMKARGAGTVTELECILPYSLAF